MDDSPASWASMPQKQQLVLITLARFCDSAAASSLQSYIFFQLKSFTQPDGSAPSTATVALQMSALSATMAMPQLVTSTLWGILADHPRMGRKRVLLLGLVVTGIGSLGLGFTSSFPAAISWRLLACSAPGNKPVMQTMIREISGDKFESRAVLLLSTAFNVGSIIGPLLGGLLADPASTYPGFIAGDSYMQWLRRWPYAPPNIVNGMILIACAVLMASQLQETLVCVRRRQPVSVLPSWAKRLFQRKSRPQYDVLVDQEHQEYELDSQGQLASTKLHGNGGPVSIWTRRLCMTLLARAAVIMHIFTYPFLLVVFFSTPRYSPVDDGSTSTFSAGETNGTANGSLFVPPGYRPHAPFTFTGGLSFKPHDIATALAIRGLMGLLLQLLFFPYLKSVFGTMKLYRYSLLVFPATYFATPFVATAASSTLPPLPAAGIQIWIAVSVILIIQTTARSFVLPSATMLLNAACPDPSALGTVNGIAQSVCAAAGAIGRLLIGWLYGVGLGYGVVGIAWWALAAVAILAAVAGAFIPTEDGDRGKLNPRGVQDERHGCVSNSTCI